jgi:hypothetical protein
MIVSMEAGIIQNSMTHTVKIGASLRDPHVAQWRGVVIPQDFAGRHDSDFKIWNEA